MRERGENEESEKRIKIQKKIFSLNKQHKTTKSLNHITCSTPLYVCVTSKMQISESTGYKRIVLHRNEYRRY